MKKIVRSSALTRRGFVAGTAAAAFTPVLIAGPAQAKAAPMRLRCRFDNQVATYKLLDNPTVHDLVSLLPLDLTIEDFSTNEKIAHLPRRLDEGGLASYDDEKPGDLCYFLGWGNLAFFHGDYRFRNDLIRLGHIEGKVDPLLHKGIYPARLELI